MTDLWTFIPRHSLLAFLSPGGCSLVCLVAMQSLLGPPSQLAAAARATILLFPNALRHPHLSSTPHGVSLSWFIARSSFSP